MSIDSVGTTNFRELTPEEIGDLTIDDFAFYIALIQTESLDEQIRDQLTAIKDKQALISEAREKLETVSSKIAACGEDGKKAITDDLETYLADQGIVDPSTNKAYTNNDKKKYTKEEWEVIKTQIENKINDLNSSVELEMLQIQSYMSKRNQALQTATNIMKKANESKDSIIGNLR